MQSRSMGSLVLGQACGATSAIEGVVEERGDEEIKGYKGQGIKGLV